MTLLAVQFSWKEKSQILFGLEQGVAKGCSLSPILFSVFITNLLVDVQEAGIGIQLNSVGGLQMTLWALVIK